MLNLRFVRAMMLCLDVLELDQQRRPHPSVLELAARQERGPYPLLEILVLALALALGQTLSLQ
jgi:hypothetical protein